MVAKKVILIITSATCEIAENLVEEFLNLGHKVAKVCQNDVRPPEHAINSSRAEWKLSENYLDLGISLEREEQINEIIPTLLSRFGRLDVLINNLSHDYQPFSLLEPDANLRFNEALQVDLYLPARVSQLAVPHLKQGPGFGVIINIAPGTGQSSPPNMFRDIVKAGLIMLTKTLANSLENHKVRCLGIVGSSDKMNARTNSTCRSHVIARISELVKFLISGESNYVNATIIEINDN